MTRSPQSSRRLSRGIAPSSHLPANQELCRALNGDRVQAFGVRRPLEHEAQSDILFDLGMIARDNAIPEMRDMRTSLHVTLLPKRDLDRQLRRGLVAAYEFGKETAAIKRRIENGTPRSVIVELGGAAIFKGNNLGLQVFSPTLCFEYEDVREHMGNVGMKGVMRDPEPLHISLASLKGNISKGARNEAIDVVNTMVQSIGEQILLDPIQFYPNQPKPGN